MSAPASERFPTLALIGVGYMGGSFALGARRAGLVDRVIGYDVDPAAGETARARGIVDEPAASPEEAVRGAGLVMLAGPVGSLVAMLARIAPHVAAEALVVDLGSVKGPIVEAAAAGPLAARFVGCHPLAGQEVSGPAHADAGLLSGKPCFLCPHPRTAASARAAAERLWRGIGATIVTMDADAHDAFMAAASHLPHVGAFSVAAALIEVSGMLEATIPPSYPPTSLRDTTRVAASNPITWRDIFLENRAHLLPLVERLEARVGALRAALEARDGAEIERFLGEARACRRRIVEGG